MQGSEVGLSVEGLPPLLPTENADRLRRVMRMGRLGPSHPSVHSESHVSRHCQTSFCRFVCAFGGMPKLPSSFVLPCPIPVSGFAFRGLWFRILDLGSTVLGLEFRPVSSRFCLEFGAECECEELRIECAASGLRAEGSGFTI